RTVPGDAFFISRSPCSVSRRASSAEPRGLPGPAVQDDGLLLGHFLDGPPGAFLADPASLQAAVGHQVSAPQRGPVEVDAAGVDLAYGLDGAGDVGGENAGR